MIRNTARAHPQHTIVAYCDNAAVMEGARGRALRCRRATPTRRATRARREHEPRADEGRDAQPPDRDLAVPGRVDRRRRRDPRRRRDRPRLASPKAGLTGFTVSNLHLPGHDEPWEQCPYGKPAHIASPLQIMIEGPLGGAAFNNEFGRPNLRGYFRDYEQTVGDGAAPRGYHKPIMIAGGLGSIDADADAQDRSSRPARC